MGYHNWCLNWLQLCLFRCFNFCISRWPRTPHLLTWLRYSSWLHPFIFKLIPHHSKKAPTFIQRGKKEQNPPLQLLLTNKTTLSGHLQPSLPTCGIQKILLLLLFVIRSVSRGFVLNCQEELLVLGAVYLQTVIMEDLQVKYATEDSWRQFQLFIIWTLRWE